MMYFESYKSLSVISLKNISTGESKTMKLKTRKRRVRLSSFKLKGLGFPFNTFIYGTGKSYVVFSCHKAVYSSVALKKMKKIKIRSQQDVIVYSDDTKEHGIEVMFESFNDIL